MTPRTPQRPRRHARARRRLRRRVRRPRARPPRRDDRQPGQLHALHAAAARGRGRQHRAAPRDRAAAHDVPARRPAARLRRLARARRARSCTCARRPATFAVAYERLVVALGSITRTPDVPGLREHALGLKDIGDAIRLRNHVLRQLELADADPASARAAADVPLRRRRLRGCRSRRRAPRTDRRCAPDGIPGSRGSGPAGSWSTRRRASSARCPTASRGFAARTLGRRGVEILSSTALVSIDRSGAVLSDGRRIETGTVVWTAGVAANPVAAQLGLPLDARGRVPVDELFRVDGPRRRARAGRHRGGAERRRPASSTRRPASTRCARRAGSSRNLRGREQAVRVQVARLDGDARPPPRHRDRRRRCACAASSAGASPAATT